MLATTTKVSSDTEIVESAILWLTMAIASFKCLTKNGYPQSWLAVTKNDAAHPIRLCSKAGSLNANGNQ